MNHSLVSLRNGFAWLYAAALIGTGACSSSDADSAAGGAGHGGGVSPAGAGASSGSFGAATAGASGGAGATGVAGSAGASLAGATSSAGASAAGSPGASGVGGSSGGAGNAGSGGAPSSGGSGSLAGSGGSAGSAGLGGAGGSGGGDPVAEAIHYFGRWQRKPSRAVTVNSGSYITAIFSGTGINAQFDVSLNDVSDLPTVAWKIDQAATWQVAEISANLALASGLSAGPHIVTLIARGLDENKNRWSAPLVSSITFSNFTVTGGALQATVAPARPKLEILGDSITEGVVVQGSSYQGKTGQCWKNDAVYSYATQTGMALAADYRQVGFGYQGLLKSGNGGVPAANDAFPWIFDGVPRDAWQADMVVINQGTNDSSKPADTFQSAYTTFVATIRKAYPGAKIVAVRPFSGAQEAPIKAVVMASNAAGDARVYYVDTSGWLTAGSDFTDSLHPNVQGSAKAAAKLVTELKRIGLP